VATAEKDARLAWPARQLSQQSIGPAGRTGKAQAWAEIVERIGVMAFGIVEASGKGSPGNVFRVTQQTKVVVWWCSPAQGVM